MVVTSLSDLYFIAAGLYALNVLTTVIMDTGLFYLPFFFIIFSFLKEWKGLESFKGLDLKIVFMMAVMVLFFMPVRTFNLDGVYSYAKQCETSEVGAVDQGFFSDDVVAKGMTVLLSSNELKMPIMIEVAFKIGTGISYFAIESLPCSLDLRGAANDLLGTQIKDFGLQVETKEFVRQCYEPVRTFAAKNRDTNLPWIEDPDTSSQPWPGHQAFMNNDYYGNVGKGFYSRSLIPGFQAAKTNQFISKWQESKEAEANGEIDCTNGQCIHQIGGFPSCREWWQGVGAGYDGVNFSSDPKGLRNRLYNHLPAEKMDRLLSLIESTYPNIDTSEQRDELINKSFFNVFALSQIKNAEVRDYGVMEESVISKGGRWINRLLGTVGNVVTAIPDFAGTSLVQLSAPIIKGAVVLILLVSFPLVMVVSKFDSKLGVAMVFLLASVMIWPFFWELSMLVQNSYIETVADDAGIPLPDILIQPNVMLLANRITDALFIGFPVFITGILSYAGIGVGSTISGMAGGMESGIAKAGSKGAREVGNAGGEAKKVATKVASKGMAK